MAKRISVTPCFTPGTGIATDRGQVAVEELRRGDRVVTRDNGIQRIEWTGRRSFDHSELRENVELRPVLVRAGAFGAGRPLRDLIVSPAHRFLVSVDQSFLNIGDDGDEHLIAARHLVDNDRVRHVDMLGVSYLHILCDRHQVILANGVWTESFHPDDRIMRGLGNSQRQELLELYPEIETIGASQRFPAARPVADGLTRFFRG